MLSMGAEACGSWVQFSRHEALGLGFRVSSLKLGNAVLGIGAQRSEILLNEHILNP